MTRRVRFLALAPFLLAAAPGAASAQTASQDTSSPPRFMSITVGDQRVHSIFRIDPITVSPGVTRHDVVCAPRPNSQRPVVTCDIRFDQPTKLVGVTIGETADPGSCARPRDCWTATQESIGASGADVADDSAFLFMLDRGGNDADTVRREDRDLVAILANAGAKQQIAVATFSRSLKIVSAFGANRTSMSGDLSRIRPDRGVTELYKSAIDGVQALADRDARRKFLVILSDGTANDTAYDQTGLVNDAKTHNVQIIAIGYAPNSRDTTQLQALRKIANDTNGAYIEVRGNNQLPASDRRSFLTRYSSGYYLSGESPSSSLPGRVYVTLRFDQNRTSQIPVDTATSPSLVGPPQGAGERPAQPTRSLLDRIWDNWAAIAVAGVVAALVAIAAFLIVRSRRARRRRDETAAPAVVAPQPHYAPPPPPAPLPDPAPVRPVFERAPERPLPRDRDDDEIATVVQGNSNGFAPTEAVPSPAGDAAKPLAFVEIEEQGRPRRFPISKNLARIGRSNENDIVLAADHVSREHAEIISNGFGGWEIKNRTWRRPTSEGGVNPIEVNGHQIEAETHPLHDGDVVRLGNIGNTHLTFRHTAQRPR